jgi:two-component system sensor histidine kinase AtoS
MRDIHVSYNGLNALKGVDFNLYNGEIHALIGEHRAGKSTLVNLISGIIKPSKGLINFWGQKETDLTPIKAMNLGVSIVHQELNIISNLNTIENIFSSKPITNRFGKVDHIKMGDKCFNLLRQLEIDIDPFVPVERLTRAEQFMVEIARSMLIKPNILILDEISNKLNPTEMEIIYKLIREMKKNGNSVIYISHNLDEILKVADRVTILKDGYRRGTENIKDLDQYKLFQLTYSFAVQKESIEKTEIHFYLMSNYIKSLIEKIPCGAIILDADENVRLMNIKGIELLEYHEDQDSDKTIKDLLMTIEEKTRNSILKKISDHTEGKWEEVKDKQGQLLFIDIFQIKDEKNNFIGTTIIIDNTTFDAQMQDYIIKSEKLATLAELATGVAHEINNPLFVIQNYIELLKLKILDDDSSIKLHKIEKELERIVAIIESLLSFSKIKKLPEKKVDVSLLIDDVILLLQYKIKYKQIEIIKKMKTKPEQGFILGDENKLKQVLINIIINAIDAILDEGEIEIIVTSPQENYIKLEIIDNGYGIPDDQIEKIFEPFFSTKLSKKNTGLGLSICQHIVSNHNGILNVYKNKEENTVFSMLFNNSHN